MATLSCDLPVRPRLGRVCFAKIIGERMPVGSRGVARQAIFMVQPAQNRRRDQLRVFRKAMTAGHGLIGGRKRLRNARPQAGVWATSIVTLGNSRLSAFRTCSAEITLCRDSVTTVLPQNCQSEGRRRAGFGVEVDHRGEISARRREHRGPDAPLPSGRTAYSGVCPCALSTADSHAA